MYTFFVGYSGVGAPSFTKFGVSAGLTLEDIERFRRYDEFERAYRECSEIRRDYLIDCGLTKRFDASFVKFVLQLEDETEESESSVPIISFEVVDE